MPEPDYEFERILIGGDRFFVCIDCGASAINPDEVRHHPTCTPHYPERMPAAVRRRR